MKTLSRTLQVDMRRIGEWQVWSRSGLKPRHEHAGYVVAVDIPSGRVAPGDYILMLSALDSSGNPEEVNSDSFRVVKP